MDRLPNDAYELWRDNEVTHRFMMFVDKQIEDLKSVNRAGSSIERIAIEAIEVQSKIDCLRMIQSWRLDNE